MQTLPVAHAVPLISQPLTQQPLTQQSLTQPPNSLLPRGTGLEWSGQDPQGGAEGADGAVEEDEADLDDMTLSQMLGLTQAELKERGKQYEKEV